MFVDKFIIAIDTNKKKLRRTLTRDFLLKNCIQSSCSKRMEHPSQSKFSKRKSIKSKKKNQQNVTFQLFFAHFAQTFRNRCKICFFRAEYYLINEKYNDSILCSYGTRFACYCAISCCFIIIRFLSILFCVIFLA